MAIKLFERVKNWGANVTRPIVSSSQDMNEHVTELKGNIRNRMDHLYQQRSKEEQDRIAEDFAALLKAWGMTEDDIPRVLRELQIRTFIYFIGVLLAIILVIQGSPISAIAVMGVSFLAIATTVWRHQILEQRRYIRIPLTKFLHSAFETRKAKQNNAQSTAENDDSTDGDQGNM